MHGVREPAAVGAGLVHHVELAEPEVAGERAGVRELDGAGHRPARGEPLGLEDRLPVTRVRDLERPAGLTDHRNGLRSAPELAATAQPDTATIAARVIHLRSGRESITVLLIYRPPEPKLSAV